MATMNISLPETMRAYVETQVATGYFANASDFLRHLIREDEKRNGSVRGLIAQAERSGISKRSPDEIIEAALEKRASRAA